LHFGGENFATNGNDGQAMLHVEFYGMAFGYNDDHGYETHIEVY
jgi:hypothetical protein